MNSWIGTDESGKGDYFGGLVIAGVMVDEHTEPKLIELGVKDSKKLSDSKVKLLSKEVQKICPHSVVMIGPEKYNELYSKLHNLNHILAWGHARVIENLLKKVNCELVITDQFGDKKYIENALMKRGKQVKLEQYPKAENNLAVAAASVLARDKFLDGLSKISAQIKVSLPKGASEKVEQVAKDLVGNYGNTILNEIAKVHFKTTNKINEQSYPALTVSDSKRLWAPWRAEYIYSPQPEKCIFCEALAKKNDESYLLYRGSKSFVMINLFPYNNGHLMVAPYRHIADTEKLTSEEISSIVELIKKSIKALNTTMNPAGFNIGMNIGAIAGAGVRDHIHIHIVPRWTGDTNFMPVISDTKIISQSIEECYKLLKKAFDKNV